MFFALFNLDIKYINPNAVIVILWLYWKCDYWKCTYYLKSISVHFHIQLVGLSLTHRYSSLEPALLSFPLAFSKCYHLLAVSISYLPPHNRLVNVRPHPIPPDLAWISCLMFIMRAYVIRSQPDTIIHHLYYLRYFPNALSRKYVQ